MANTTIKVKMEEQAKQALLKSARQNFVGGYTDCQMIGNPFLERDKVEEVGNKLFDAISGVVEVLAERNQAQ